MEPQTVSGRAALSATRPHVRRALGPTIVAIESEAAAPYRTVLADAVAVLRDLAAAASGERSARARAVIARAESLLD